ncbi:hypothetical protein AALP_AA4G063900 [Arabis alpina]|uniref:Alpha/beta hydrolase fold-3 domain-containing protein n=1 Tax=Arabis alpina TaxID=50452 RepID=A0A087H1I9_ARAAL|nr:hypothetical protein AALP_AA4G063900 [Arabis alpina]
MLRTLTFPSSHSLFFHFFRHFPHSLPPLPLSLISITVSDQNLRRKLTPTTLRCISSHSPSDILSEHPPFIRIYKDGHIERLSNTETIPASLTPQNDVITKDIIYSPDLNLSVRLFLPHKSITTSNTNNNKLPLLIYIHGGAWLIGSPFSPIYHNFLTKVTKSSNCLTVSLQYRLAPENPVPAAYEDSWSAIQWIYTHEEDWINEYADFKKVFLAGDSAGGNMCHHMAVKAGEEKLEPRFKGVVIVHPAFWGKDPIDEEDLQDLEESDRIGEVWEKLVSPTSVDGVDDPLFNVVGSGSGSGFGVLGCEKVLVAVAGKDVFVRQGLGYAAKLEKSGWGGEVEVMVEEDEGHCFHLLNPDSENAPKFMKRFVEFITG